jgi:hypothetical protein
MMRSVRMDISYFRNTRRQNLAATVPSRIAAAAGSRAVLGPIVSAIRIQLEDDEQRGFQVVRERRLQ